MKAKIAENEIVFKISEDEMQHLLVKSSLETKVVIGGGVFCIAINLTPDEIKADAQDTSLVLMQDSMGTGIVLRTQREEIQKLADMGKDKNGLSLKIGNLDVKLQVDVRKDSRTRKD